MRSRKKKNLTERLAKVTETLIFEDGKDFYKTLERDKYRYLDIENIFGNNRQVHLEIGCGKGGFITQIAQLNPDINYIAVEKTKNIIVSAMESAKLLGLENLRFINADAYNLKYVLKNESISRIYLNFSCPYPKESYANNRLTNPKFLEIYKAIMYEKAEIHQKTDSKLLFDYSVRELCANGFAIISVTDDLYGGTLIGNIATEYEKYFVAKGKPIYQLVAVAPKKN